MHSSSGSKSSFCHARPRYFDTSSVMSLERNLTSFCMSHWASEACFEEIAETRTSGVSVLSFSDGITSINCRTNRWHERCNKSFCHLGSSASPAIRAFGVCSLDESPSESRRIPSCGFCTVHAAMIAPLIRSGLASRMRSTNGAHRSRTTRSYHVWSFFKAVVTRLSSRLMLFSSISLNAAILFWDCKAATKHRIQTFMRCFDFRSATILLTICAASRLE